MPNFEVRLSVTIKADDLEHAEELAEYLAEDAELLAEPIIGMIVVDQVKPWPTNQTKRRAG